MMAYLLKSITCLLILLLAHRLLLQREAMHRFNRFFLLFSVVASFLVPLVTIEVAPEPLTPVEVMSEQVYYETVEGDYINEMPVYDAVDEAKFDWDYLIYGIYGVISLIFFIRFVRNIKILVNRIQRNVKISYRGQTLVLLKEESLPFSFLNYIFVAESDLEAGKFTDAVFAHECTHVQEKHSWDNLFIEALLVPLWFHPGLHWAKASIKLNHEFIADEVALRTTSLEKYERQLLAMMLFGQKYGLVSSLNFSLTKKRFEMMKRKSVNPKSWIKILVLIPVVGALVYFFSERVTAQVDKSTSEFFVNAPNEENIDFDFTFELNPTGTIGYENKEYDLEGIEDLIKERKAVKADLKINLITYPDISMGDLEDFQTVLRDLDIRNVHYVSQDQKSNENNTTQNTGKAKHFANVKFLIENDQMYYSVRSYEELSDQQKSMLSLPQKAPSKRSPDDSVYQVFKNSKTFGLWLDGEVIPTRKLDEINKDEIAYFVTSRVYDNAKSERFPQPYQVSLFTEKFYDKFYGPDAEMWKPRQGTVIFSASPLAVYMIDLSKSPNPTGEYLDVYNKYEEIRTAEPHFIDKQREEKYEMHSLYSHLIGMYFQFDSELKAKVFRPTAPHAPYVKLKKGSEVYYKLQKDLNEEERNQLSSPPSTPTQKNNKQSVIGSDIVNNLDAKSNVSAEYIILKYKILNDKYEKQRNEKPHFMQRNEADQNILMKLYSDLGEEYYRIRLSDKPKVDRPIHPYDPYIKLASNGKVYYKLKDDLTDEERNQLPPPPALKDIVSAYHQIFLKYELMRQEGRNYNNKSLEEREIMYQMYNELQDKFLAMEPAQRRQVKMVNFPYIRLEENGLMVFKATDELSPEQRALAGC
ncbi:hypothetical protein J2X69_004053 [Algoriphagus sp. 4150]|uniref:M56 family metallopeptidase n=1 Tax=Algoriphagus sp. 4150 TaxID=2817756 RepID=UPI0028561A4D|nr:M56 family metallopeptidase [Algoriphagus sp. 4150]MDR7131689.1 hypothetical protein [Algoriphagus sp. 4150]